MNPRLFALAGPLRGSVCALADGQEVLLNHEGGIAPPGTDASPPEPHCRVRSAAGKFILSSAGNHNRALVNGAPAAARELQHGDEIQIGDSRWRFLVEEDPSVAPVDSWQARNTVGFNELLCQNCGACAAVCPTGALRLRLPGELQHDMVGLSTAMRRVYEFISRVAPTDSTVLLFGESGTGKELAARAIHRNSRRAEKPFVAINCAALAPTLLESELFGHERGAFTGALAQKKGKLEIAHGGTVFLDEIAELNLELQVKLLRVLQERELERVGATRPTQVDFRLVAATNQELEEAVRAGRFRPDLYYRLNVVSICMPSLRERREDIPLLANCFLARYSAKCGRRVLGFSDKARECLSNYDWPGNVRELENAIERAVVLGSAELVLPEDLPEAILDEGPAGGAIGTKYHEAVREAKRQLILKTLEQSGGSYKEAAELMGIHPNYLHRLIRNLGLRPALKKGIP